VAAAPPAAERVVQPLDDDFVAGHLLLIALDTSPEPSGRSWLPVRDLLGLTSRLDKSRRYLFERGLIERVDKSASGILAVDEPVQLTDPAVVAVDRFTKRLFPIVNDNDRLAAPGALPDDFPAKFLRRTLFIEVINALADEFGPRTKAEVTAAMTAGHSTAGNVFDTVTSSPGLWLPLRGVRRWHAPSGATVGALDLFAATTHDLFESVVKKRGITVPHEAIHPSWKRVRAAGSAERVRARAPMTYGTLRALLATGIVGEFAKTSAIAKVMDVTQETVNKQMPLLEQQGLVVRSPGLYGRGDGWSLSPAGRNFGAGALPALLQEAVLASTQKLTGEERISRRDGPLSARFDTPASATALISLHCASRDEFTAKELKATFRDLGGQRVETAIKFLCDLGMTGDANGYKLPNGLRDELVVRAQHMNAFLQAAEVAFLPQATHCHSKQSQCGIDLYEMG
jgi:DNA-binding MarR family transcriptional regulator